MFELHLHNRKWECVHGVIVHGVGLTRIAAKLRHSTTAPSFNISDNWVNVRCWLFAIPYSHLSTSWLNLEIEIEFGWCRSIRTRVSLNVRETKCKQLNEINNSPHASQFYFPVFFLLSYFLIGIASVSIFYKYSWCPKFLTKFQWKMPLWRSKFRWEDNVKMNLRQRYADCIKLAQDRLQ
jgi:hypothetical protein